ncbi:MAG: type II toxin-antitoxin system prevent-host-death family antitoxin [Thermomicrobiales bacterium]
MATREALDEVPLGATSDVVISEEDVSSSFASVLERVEAGQRFVVTRNGEPVARIGPASPLDIAEEAARAALFARLRSQPALNAGPWTRDELYDDE